MKKIALATAAAAFALTTGVAFAENPYLIPEEQQQDVTPAQASHHSYGAPSVSLRKLQGAQEHRYANPAANRFGDAQPRD